PAPVTAACGGFTSSRASPHASPVASALGDFRPSAGPAKLFHVQRRLLAVLLALSLACAGAAGASTAARSPAAACKERAYVVRAGDTLFSIAGRFGTTVQAIAHANRLDPNGILRIGVRLRIPSTGCRDAAQ